MSLDSNCWDNFSPSFYKSVKGYQALNKHLFNSPNTLKTIWYILHPFQSSPLLSHFPLCCTLISMSLHFNLISFRIYKLFDSSLKFVVEVDWTPRLWSSPWFTAQSNASRLLAPIWPNGSEKQKQHTSLIIRRPSRPMKRGNSIFYSQVQNNGVIGAVVGFEVIFWLFNIGWLKGFCCFVWCRIGLETKGSWFCFGND